MYGGNILTNYDWHLRSGLCDDINDNKENSNSV